MIKYFAAALAAFSLSAGATPVAAQEPQVIPAACSAQIAADTFGPEACHVVVQTDANGGMAIGFALSESGNVVFGGSPQNGGMTVVMMSFGQDPFEATGTCTATERMLTCTATAQGVRVIVKATI
jgi:hypothetical protein